ncbi:MAG: CoA pyrophosphatase [Anaerolineae bacterium]
MTPVVSIEQIQQALTLQLPGIDAWTRMAPRQRNLALPEATTPRLAGVLILLYPLDESIYMVLTRRTDDLATHRGQISLPGGGLKVGETPEDAALREAHEELGIAIDDVKVMGELTPLYIPPSNYLIHPIVAHLPGRPAFAPDPGEVAELLEVPLSVLFAADTRAEETWEIRGLPTLVPFYRLAGHKVWGATAMVLAEFTALLEAAAHSSPSP